MLKPVVCFVGPTGVGKTSYAMRLIDEYDYTPCRVYVTRPARDDDRPHVCFVSISQFRRLHDRGGLLECDTFHGHWYGTCRQSFRRLLDDACVRGIILDLTPEGARQVRRVVPWARVIALVPDTQSWLERRLVERGTDEPVEIDGRIAGLKRYFNALSNLEAEQVCCFESPTTWTTTFDEILIRLRLRRG